MANLAWAEGKTQNIALMYLKHWSVTEVSRLVRKGSSTAINATTHFSGILIGNRMPF